jgi:hypothetical protein
MLSAAGAADLPRRTRRPRRRLMGKIINSTFVSLDGVINHMQAWHFDSSAGSSSSSAVPALR